MQGKSFQVAALACRAGLSCCSSSWAISQLLTRSKLLTPYLLIQRSSALPHICCHALKCLHGHACMAFRIAPGLHRLDTEAEADCGL